MTTSPDPLGLTVAQRAQSDWAERARRAEQQRAKERVESAHSELTLDAVLDKLGWSREYAEHFVQPYCICECTRDGWEHCDHAIDLNLY